MDYFFHGLESSPTSRKAQFLRGHCADLVVPDFSGLPKNSDSWLEHAQKVVTEPGFIIGSSFGGLTAARLANQCPELVLGYVLCAPALHWPHPEIKRVPDYAHIVRGSLDTVVPYSCCADFALEFSLPFQQVEDDHFMNRPDTLNLLVEILAQIKREYTRDSRWA